ncbi:hypothetical protein RNZ50_05040 [Paracoccaceae bacterium Fryx2]|nr:hypothetical protein [Paracoccaceae bacterium Fryx2]
MVFMQCSDDVVSATQHGVTRRGSCRTVPDRVTQPDRAERPARRGIFLPGVEFVRHAVAHNVLESVDQACRSVGAGTCAAIAATPSASSCESACRRIVIAIAMLCAAGHRAGMATPLSLEPTQQRRGWGPRDGYPGDAVVGR